MRQKQSENNLEFSQIFNLQCTTCFLSSDTFHTICGPRHIHFYMFQRKCEEGSEWQHNDLLEIDLNEQKHRKEFLPHEDNIVSAEAFASPAKSPAIAKRLSASTLEDKAIEDARGGGGIIWQAVSDDKETEFDVFGKYIACQLKQLPLANAVSLQIKIHSLIGEERLQVIRQMKDNNDV